MSGIELIVGCISSTKKKEYLKLRPEKNEILSIHYQRLCTEILNGPPFKR